MFFLVPFRLMDGYLSFIYKFGYAIDSIETHDQEHVLIQVGVDASYWNLVQKGLVPEFHIVRRGLPHHRHRLQLPFGVNDAS
jgi:hypothetical protein